MQIRTAYPARFDLDDNAIWLEQRVFDIFNPYVALAVKHRRLHAPILSFRIPARHHSSPTKSLRNANAIYSRLTGIPCLR
jgi:hypothetical protein